MKIMIYISSMDGGGSERQNTIFSNNFIECGHEVCIVKKSRQIPSYPLNSNVRIIDARELQNSRNIIQAVSNNISNIIDMRKIIQNEKPDIIFCIDVTRLFEALLARLFNRYSRIVYFEPNNPLKSLEGKIWNKLKKTLSRLADGCLFQTERAAEYYPESVRKKSVVIPNPIESNKYKTLKDVTTRRKIVVTVGRLEPQKGQDVLLKAFCKVRRDFPDYYLVIFGEGRERKKLTDLSMNLGIGDSVNLPGFSDDVIRDILDASVFVLSSNYEGMPNALMEALACGLPCVSTDCDMGPRELIKDGENGLLVPVGDVDSMAEAIAMILSSDELANRLGRNARGILSTHDERVISQQLLDFFSSLI